jgi:hypothetical protein
LCNSSRLAGVVSKALRRKCRCHLAGLKAEKAPDQIDERDRDGEDAEGAEPEEVGDQRYLGCVPGDDDTGADGELQSVAGEAARLRIEVLPDAVP